MSRRNLEGVIARLDFHYRDIEVCALGLEKVIAVGLITRIG